MHSPFLRSLGGVVGVPFFRQTGPMESGFEFQGWPVYREAVALSRDCFLLCSRLPKEGTKSGVEAELPKIRERLVLMGKMLSGFIRYLETQEPKRRGD